jgi:hypothetical protein
MRSSYQKQRILARHVVRFHQPAEVGLQTITRDKPQYAVTLLPGNEVRFLSLSRTAKVKPDYRPMAAERYHSKDAEFAVDHYKATGRILLHAEVKAILL